MFKSSTSSPSRPRPRHAHDAQGGDSVKLTIGYHQLEGKRVPLKKPYAILDRAAPAQPQHAEQQQAQQQAQQPRGEQPQGEQQQQQQQREGEAAQPHAGYMVIGVVRSKLLFKTRPRALISKPAGK